MGDSSDEDEIYAATIATISIMCAVTKKNQKRKLWTRKWLKRRETGKGILNMLNTELKVKDPDAYRNYLRMSNNLFEKLLKIVGDDISCKDTLICDITLCFLATGESYRSLMYLTRI
ncbi:hypothetical protein RN001_000882 [Aquatica leii]|uniref:Uncharacterized protein n=1 Tax=Aquatica leii TaxID=1421715 RepID=A0AAN7SCG3_9COLE|nr:hypothetical protein RN001_000882 [Aquatica leii]